MAYTYIQLSKAYAAAHGGIEPTGQAAEDLQRLTAAPESEALSYILASADKTTAVAVMTYQFFTGQSPSADGIAYLLNSAANANDLNDDYYAKFNLENRFMNFAANLALGSTAGIRFANTYGEMSFGDYVASIYETIIGKTFAKAAGLDPDKIIADVVARRDLILQSARDNGMIGANATPAQIDLALKTATAAYLLGEGAKADIGIYAGATNNFVLALVKGEPFYNVDITQTYAPRPGSGSAGTGKAVDIPPPAHVLPGAPPPPVTEPEPPAPPPSGQSFVLTAGTDKFTGAATNDTFIGTNTTYGYSDILDGGAGHDSLTLTATVGAGSIYNMPNQGAVGIETLTITSSAGVYAQTTNWTGVEDITITSKGATTVEADTSTVIKATVTGQGGEQIAIYGGKDVTVTSTGAAAAGVISVGANWSQVTGDVVVSRQTTSGATAGAITVEGGKTVSVTQTLGGATHTNGVVTINGSTATTEVTVKASSGLANTVTINDINKASGSVAGTITKASVDRYGKLSINGAGLTDLSLANGNNDVLIANGGAHPARTLNLSVNNLTSQAADDMDPLLFPAQGVLKDSGAYATLNVTTGASASSFADVQMAGLTTLNVSGDSKLTLRSVDGLTALQTVAVTGAAGLSANLSAAPVTSVSTAGATGASTLTLNGANTGFTGGAGADDITLSSSTVNHAISLGGGNDVIFLRTGTRVPTVTIDGGTGTDTLMIAAADLAAITQLSDFAAKVVNFDILYLLGATNQTFDLAALGYSYVKTAGASNLTLNNFAANGTLELTSGGQRYTLNNTAFTAGANDTVNVLLSGNSASAFAQTGVTASGVETVNIKVDVGNTVQSSMTLLGNDAKSITITGNNGLDLTATSSALLNLDASGLTGNFNWASGNPGDASTVKGSATGVNTVDLTASFYRVNYTGSSAADVITIKTNSSHILNLGDGDNVVTETTGINGRLEVRAGSGNDTVNLRSGYQMVYLGDGTNTLTLTGVWTGRYEGGAGSDTVTFGGGSAYILLGSGADKVVVTAPSTYQPSIEGFSSDDQLEFRHASGVAPTSLAPQLTGQTTIGAYQAQAAAGNGSATAIMSWFQVDGATYVVLDKSAASTYVTGTDDMIKLVGTVNLTGWTVVNGVLTGPDVL